MKSVKNDETEEFGHELVSDLMEFNEKDYPMTYKEYEKRVIELFLESYEGETLELMKKRVEDVLSEEPNFIQMLYGQDCFTYESPDIFGETAKKKHLKTVF